MKTYWNYRVIERRRSIKTTRSHSKRYVAIHRVTYTDKDRTKILNISSELMLPVGDTKKELTQELNYVALAAKLPAVPWKTAKMYLKTNKITTSTKTTTTKTPTITTTSKTVSPYRYT